MTKYPIPKAFLSQYSHFLSKYIGVERNQKKKTVLRVNERK